MSFVAVRLEQSLSLRYTGDEIIEAFKSISEDEVAKGVINAKKLSSVSIELDC